MQLRKTFILSAALSLFFLVGGQASAAEIENDFEQMIGLEFWGSTPGGLSYRNFHTPETASRVWVFGYGTSGDAMVNLGYAFEIGIYKFKLPNAEVQIYAAPGVGLVYAEGNSAFSIEKEFFSPQAAQNKFSAPTEFSLKPFVGLGGQMFFDPIAVGVELQPFVANVSLKGQGLVAVYPSVSLSFGLAF